MYELTCPHCQDVRQVSFVRLDAVTVCPNCRQGFQVAAEHFRRIGSDERPAADTPAPAPSTPLGDDEPALTEPHELLHPPEANEAAVGQRSAWHRRLLRRFLPGRIDTSHEQPPAD